MLRLKNYILIIGLFAVILIFIFFIGIHLWLSTFKRFVYWQKENVRVEGQVNTETHKREFNRIFLGDPQHYFYGKPPLSVGLPEGGKLCLSNMTYEKIQKISTDWSGYVTIPDYKGPSWPERTVFRLISKRDPSLNINLSYPCYTFAIVDEHVVGVVIWGKWCEEICDEKSGKKYIFPITQNEVEELFGEPDKVSEGIVFWEF